MQARLNKGSQAFGQPPRITDSRLERQRHCAAPVERHSLRRAPHAPLKVRALYGKHRIREHSKSCTMRPESALRPRRRDGLLMHNAHQPTTFGIPVLTTRSTRDASRAAKSAPIWLEARAKRVFNRLPSR